MSNGLQYTEIHSSESFGHRAIGIKILVSTPKHLSPSAFGKISYDLADKIEKVIKEDLDKQDPERQANIVEERAALVALFPQPIYVKSIENEYGERMDFPWFNVTTSKGVIKIGWRRNVINIDWSESDIRAEAKDLFSEEKVTKGEHYIHAWGYEKAKEYIDKILGV